MEHFAEIAKGTQRILKEKNGGSDISTLAAYGITPTTILNKSRFRETKHEEVYIRMIITKN